ncbi:uncharacterized protein IWZ02DRAFT_457819 [Phyllosticta citriasiana]|uniref:uncharacterized protein n=1 Tax=Phyllosticta citriasiana TaxID=595635 RepID=UPI0030FD75B0
MEELPSVVTAVLRLCCLAQTACTAPCLSLSSWLSFSSFVALLCSRVVQYHFCPDCVLLSALFSLGFLHFINDIAALGRRC